MDAITICLDLVLKHAWKQPFCLKHVGIVARGPPYERQTRSFQQWICNDDLWFACDKYVNFYQDYSLASNDSSTSMNMQIERRIPWPW